MKPALTILLPLLASSAFAADFHVAPNGDDANPGTKEKPFATLVRAREAARSSKNSTVILAAGAYRLAKTFELDEMDSGTTYRAAPGADVQLSGGVAIPNSAVKPVSDQAILDRLVREIRGQVMEVDLGALGIKDFGGIGPRGFRRPYIPAPLELFVDGEPLAVAQWPNPGQPGEPIGKVLDRGSVPRNGENPVRGGTFMFKTDRPERWTQANDIWITGLFSNGYADNTVKVKAIDLEKKTLTTVHPHMYGFASGKSWNRWSALNLLEEIDIPGEFYADQATGKLYFIPPNGADLATCRIEVSMLKTPVIAIEGASGVVFDGITIENSRGMGVYIERGANNRIQNGTLRNLGMVAVSIGKGISPDPDYRHGFTGTPVSRELGSWHEHIYDNTTLDREAGTGHGIINCEIHNIGAGAISLGGGNRIQLKPAGNFVENCHFHHFNRWDRSYKGAVNIDGVGNRIAHCLIHDAPALVIYIHGNDHLIEYNEIRDVMRDADEMGAVYMGRDPSERGTVIRHNYFHHIGKWEKAELRSHGTVALHFDDGCGNGTTVSGNIFWRAGSTGAMIIGDETTVKNNVFIDCHTIQDPMDERWYSLNKNDPDRFPKRLKAVGFDRSPWTERYPGFDTFLDDLPTHKRNNIFTTNLLINCNWMRSVRKGKPDWLTKENNREEKTEPGIFVDAANGDFALKSGADVGIPGFEPIPFDKIGLRE